MTRSGFSLAAAFRCAARGIADSSRERNFRIELAFMAACVVLGFAFSIDSIEWVACLMCCGLVLGGECFNCAIEAVVDLASPERCELARVAKDAAAGGVLLFSIASFLVGVIVFAPRILQALGLL